MPIKLNMGESQTTLEMEEAGLVTFTGFRETLEKTECQLGQRDQRVVWRYIQDNYIRSKPTPINEFYPMYKAFLMGPARQKHIDSIRNKMRSSVNFWKLDNLCGLSGLHEEQAIDADPKTRMELERLQRAASRLPIDTTEKDTRKRDWLFQRYDIGKQGRLVMAAVDNMIHVQFGSLGYDIKDVVRAAFRATKHVSFEADTGASAGYIERPEFRLLLLALKSHIELFIAFRTIDASRDMKIDFDEFQKCLPLLEKWNVDVTDPQHLFDLIDQDHSGEITFNEFVNWALKEAIISDLETRERLSHNVTLGEQVLLLGDFMGQTGQVVSYNRQNKKYIVQLDDGTKVELDVHSFATGSAINEVLPKLEGNNHIGVFERLLQEIMPGTDHPWITEEPTYVKSEHSNKPGEYLFEIRCIFGGDDMKSNSWAKSFREAQNFAAKKLMAKISKHPKINEVVDYVNKEVAEERDMENKRRLELIRDQDDDEADAQEYQENIWRREIIGKSKVDQNELCLILNDCGANIKDREVKIIFRHLGRNNEPISLTSVEDFWSDNKIVDSKLKALRQRCMKEWSQKSWQGFLLRSNPDETEKFQKEFDKQLKKSKKKKPKLADFLEYTDYSKAADPNAEEEVLAKEEVVPGADGDHEGRGVSKETRSRLRGFLDSVPAQSEAEILAATPKDPEVKLVEVSLTKSKSAGSPGGGLVVKKTTASNTTQRKKQRRGKKSMSRSRSGRGR